MTNDDNKVEAIGLDDILESIGGMVGQSINSPTTTEQWEEWAIALSKSIKANRPCIEAGREVREYTLESSLVVALKHIPDNYECPVCLAENRKIHPAKQQNPECPIDSARRLTAEFVEDGDDDE